MLRADKICADAKLETGNYLSRHLVNNRSDKFVRFFQAEALVRWPIDFDDVADLTGNGDELVAFLGKQFGFATRRAEIEAADFLSMLHEKIERAQTIKLLISGQAD